MISTANIIAVLAFAAAANAQAQTGVCRIVQNNFGALCGNTGSDTDANNKIYACRENECTTMGCVFSESGNSHRCRQPVACTAGGDIVYQGATTGLKATRKPISPEVARLCDSDNDCSAMYQVDLSARWTTGPPNCNDMAMLPPHGVNQSECTEMKPHLFNNRLMDYVGHPFKNDGVKQSVAASKNAVTAITEDSDNCVTGSGDTNNNCAFPLGFMSDTIRKGFKVCVQIRNANDKWIEIMAASKSGSDASFCVRDRNKDENVDGDKGCTKAGDLVDIRESGQSLGTDAMSIEFFTEDNFDDANIDFHWRVAASMLTSTDPKEDKDGEDWAQFRDGADYPMSLMKPYPEGYEGDAVFETESDSSASWVSPSVFTVLVAALASAIM